MAISNEKTDDPIDTTRVVNDEQRWQALARRDRAADGAFVYSVRTTGVYCRPWCPSKHPLRENVRFHATCEEAERAGFRACKRCRPRDSAHGECHRDAIALACRMIETSKKAPDLGQIAEAVGMSRFYFHRVFKMYTGITPKAYGAANRTNRLRERLEEGSTVTAAIIDAGFGSNGRFYESASADLGMSASAYHSKGAGAIIRFAVGECSLGSILVAATAVGVCAIFLGDDPETLARELQDRFRKAEIVAADASFDQWVAEVVASAENPSLALSLPLDIQGTAFQRRVWEALRQIPLGQTSTYTEIARLIGKPSAARAVAGACAANPIAIAIPCHRVIRIDDSLSGYRWGVERKAELLKRERVLQFTEASKGSP